jgi:hypothetical protein
MFQKKRQLLVIITLVFLTAGLFPTVIFAFAQNIDQQPDFVISNVILKNTKTALITVKNQGGGVDGYYPNGVTKLPLNLVIAQATSKCNKANQDATKCEPHVNTAIDESFYVAGFEKTIELALPAEVKDGINEISLWVGVDLIAGTKGGYYKEYKENNNVMVKKVKVPRPDFVITNIKLKNTRTAQITVKNQGADVDGHYPNGTTILPLNLAIAQATSNCNKANQDATKCEPHVNTALDEPFYKTGFEKTIELDLPNEVKSGVNEISLWVAVDWGIDHYYNESNKKNNVMVKRVKVPRPDFVIANIKLKNTKTALITVKNQGADVDGHYPNGTTILPLNLVIAQATNKCNKANQDATKCEPHVNTALDEPFYKTGFEKTIELDLPTELKSGTSSISLWVGIDLISNTNGGYYQESKENNNVMVKKVSIAK